MENAVTQQASLVMMNTEALGQLENMETGFSLTVKYKTREDWQAIKDVPVRCFFLGIKEIPTEHGEALNCAAFQSQTESFISAQTTLIDAVRMLTPGTPIQIVYIGESKNKSTSGSTCRFDVSLLK